MVEKPGRVRSKNLYLFPTVAIINFHKLGGLEQHKFTVMYCLMVRIHSEKCFIGLFGHCVNITEYIYTNQDGIAYYTPRLFDMPIAPRIHI